MVVVVVVVVGLEEMSGSTGAVRVQVRLCARVRGYGMDVCVANPGRGRARERYAVRVAIGRLCWRLLL